MDSFSTIRVDRDDHRPVVRVTLNRPDIGNAIDADMVGELRQCLHGLRGELADDDRPTGPRALVLAGEGEVFSVGPHADQLRQQVEYSHEANVAEARELTGLLNDLYTLPLATIASINGPVIGAAALGLICCCDMAVAVEDALFGFNELRLGLVPAVAAPFVIRCIGERHAREAMLTGAPVTAAHAWRIGLLQQTVTADGLDAAVDARVSALTSCGPDAIRACKELIADVSGRPLEEVTDFTVDVFARSRMGAEGREGMAAALEDRRPDWADVAGTDTDNRTDDEGDRS